MSLLHLVQGLSLRSDKELGPYEPTFDLAPAVLLLPAGHLRAVSELAYYL